MSNLIQLQPNDQHNQKLESNVHPANWQNPQPAGRYNLVVVGAGTASLVTAVGAAGLGAKAAHVERELMGGDCLTVDCVPSKGLISAARIVRPIKYADEFGITASEKANVGFPNVMQRIRKLRADISPHDSAARFRDLGIDIFFGQGTFTSSNSLQVGEQTLNFKKAVIATGARAAAPPIPGLDQVEYLTNESVCSLTELPRSLGIVGGGPIGCEMAQTFALLGSKIYLVQGNDQILERDDPDATKTVKESMSRDGVHFLKQGMKLELKRDDQGQIHLTNSSPDANYDQPVDKLLIAIGRSKASSRTIPWATYTSPEVAQLGLTAAQAAEQGIAIQTFTQDFADIDRAILSGETEGFVRVHVRQGSDKIAGSTIVASHADDLPGELSLAMSHGLGLKKIASAIHPYPTIAESIRKIGDQYNRTRLTPLVKSLMRKWFTWNC